MRPKLKNDTLYVPSENGIYFAASHGNFALQGPQIYQWVDRIAPFLDGSRTLEDLVDGLPAAQVEMVSGLVTLLAERGYVKDVADDEPHSLEPDEEEAFSAEIAFVDHYRGSAARRFQTYRESRVLMVGAGTTLTGLVHAGLQSGLRTAHVLVTGECVTDRARHTEYLELARERDPGQRLVEHPAAGLADPALDATIAGFDAVLHVSDRAMTGRALRLSRACARAGVSLVQAVVLGDTAWIGPVSAGGACWECTWRRLLGHGAPHPGDPWADRADEPAGEFLAGPTASMVANHVGFELFRHVTGAQPDDARAVLTELDLETLDTRVHPVSRHPLCRVHGARAGTGRGARAERLGRLEQGPPLDPDVIAKAAAELFAERTGVLGTLDECDVEQLPLKVCRATVSNPTGSPGPEPAVVFGVARDYAGARLRATVRGCEVYAATLASVPSMLGVASGLTLAEAVTRGMVDRCRALTLAAASADGPAFPRVDAHAVDAEPVQRYLRVAGTFAGVPDVHDVTGRLGVPTFVACRADRTIASAADLDPLRALELLLEAVLQHDQSRANGQPAYAPPAVAQLPACRRRGARVTGLRVAPEPDHRHWETLSGRLADAGHRTVVEPLDGDPVLAAVLPYIVWVGRSDDG